MGGVTTWDVLAYQSEYFSYFMPMAGDSWLSQAEDVSDDDEFADWIAKGISDNGLSSDDFRIVAMVGQDDGTKYSMQPQIEALRSRHPELFTDDSLIYWENRNGGHNQESLEAETQHGVKYLWN